MEAGDCTPLEQKKLRLKILAEEVRREEAEARLEKQSEKARKQKAPKQSEKAKKRPHEENQEHGDLKKKRVADLKKICEDKGLDPKGKKAELIQRLSQGASSSSGGEVPDGQDAEQAAHASSGSGGEVPPAGQNGEQAAEGGEVRNSKQLLRAVCSLLEPETDDEVGENGEQAAEGVASSGSGGEVPAEGATPTLASDDSDLEGRDL